MNFTHNSGIYSCVCNKNGMRYIGQSQDVKLRKCVHLSALRYNHHYNHLLQEAFNLYGEDSFIWDVVEYCEPERLDERERYWICYYDTYKNGFNRNDGGKSNRGFERNASFRERVSLSVKHSWENADVRRERLSKSMLGARNPMFGRRGQLNPMFGVDRSGEKGTMYGKQHTAEAKEKNRIAHLGAKNKNSKPVICVETSKMFSSQGEGAREMRCDSSTINKCCRGVKKTAGGFHWRYATEDEINSKHNI